MSALKPATSIDQQIEILRERGMSVDEPLARQWLASVSYYRLSGYWYAYRVLPADADPKNPHRLDKFQQQTSFSDIARLYEFDRKLRTLIHDGMERIEVALRARISDRLASIGALSYLDPAVFRPDFEHSAWCNTALARVERAKKRDTAIKHYASKYAVHGVEQFENDWYEYVQYGTANPVTILLQRFGFTRESATYIRRNVPTPIIQKDGEYYLNPELLENQNRNVSKEANEIKYNVPEAFS